MDEIKLKSLSNPVSTGGGGHIFEACIQAKFVTLMLSGGLSPCLPPWPIKEIKLQGKVAGYETDDLIIYVQDPAGGEVRKLLGQVKRSVSITRRDQTFADVILAAWADYNNPEVFSRNRDVIALITGPINSTDMEGVNTLLEQARHTKDDAEFFMNISKAKFCNDNVRNKLNVFREHLKSANGNIPITDAQLRDFLRHFHYLGYDLNRQNGVTSSLLQSHISQFNREMPAQVWSEIVYEVQNFNQSGGTITRNNISESIARYFQKKSLDYIPHNFVINESRKREDWSIHELADQLFILNMVGGWDEKNQADRELIERFFSVKAEEWVIALRKLSLLPDGPVKFKNGVWKITERMECWDNLSGHIFDEHVTDFCSLFLTVMAKSDKKLSVLNQDITFSFGFDNGLVYSEPLRKGVSESFALLGTSRTRNKNCSANITDLKLGEVLSRLLAADEWELWATLDRFMPEFAEGAPEKFLKILQEKSQDCPDLFFTLLKETDTGYSQVKHCLGLLGALETLAWQDMYFVRSVMILCSLAQRDSAGRIQNSPFNSLKEIFVPWRPHTSANMEKQQACLKLIFKNAENVGWALTSSLLPNRMTTSHGTRVPKWSKYGQKEWEITVTTDAYWRVCQFLAAELIERLGTDVNRFVNVIELYTSLPAPQSDLFVIKLNNLDPALLSEDEKSKLWDALLGFTSRHESYPDADWSLSSVQLEPFRSITDRFRPADKLKIYCKYFTDDIYAKYAGNGWEEYESVQKANQNAAVADIFYDGGLCKVIEFASGISRNYLVGISLAEIGDSETDYDICSMLSQFFNKSLFSFLSAYLSGRFRTQGWSWYDQLDTSALSAHNAAYLLLCMPFSEEAWNRLSLEKEHLYWKNVSPDFYRKFEDINFPLRQLLKHKRPGVAINSINQCIFFKNYVISDIVIDSLLSFSHKEKDVNNDTVPDIHAISTLINFLQENKSVPHTQMLAIEWKYFFITGPHSGIQPVTLFMEMSDNPAFYIQVLSVIFRSGDEDQDNEENRTTDMQEAASTAYQLLTSWNKVPGTDLSGKFDAGRFKSWLSEMESMAREAGQLDVALYYLGGALKSSPADPGGLWIHLVIAEALDQAPMKKMLDGFRIGLLNSRGAHFVDPEAKEEIALAEQFRLRASEVENQGYMELADCLMYISRQYADEARDRLRD